MFQDAPSFLRIHSGPLYDYNFHVHVKRYLISDLPRSEIELKKWVMDRFADKNKYLSSVEKHWHSCRVLDLTRLN